MLFGRIFIGILFLGAVLIPAQVAIFPYGDEGALYDSATGRTYFQSEMGGARALISITYAQTNRDKQTIANAMVGLLGMQTGLGDWASRVAFRRKFSVLICFTSEYLETDFMQFWKSEWRFEHMHFYFLLISENLCYNETIIYWNEGGKAIWQKK